MKDIYSYLAYAQTSLEYEWLRGKRVVSDDLPCGFFREIET
jgi:hypothetical protein